MAVIRRVRREVEGPIGGTDYYYSGGGGGDGFGRPSGVRHALLLRYIINPPDGEYCMIWDGSSGSVVVSGGFPGVATGKMLLLLGR